MQPAPAFSLTTLGSVRLAGPSGQLLRGRRKELALLTYLSRQSPKAVSREELSALLWGERDEQRARQSLRHALYQLRRALGDAIDVTSGSIGVVEGTIQLDATLLEREVAAGRPGAALSLWNGDFLCGCEAVGHEEFRTWLEREREALRRTLTAAFARIVSGARQENRTIDEIQWARRWTACCSFDDDAHAALIKALLRADEALEAHTVHSIFQARLRSELDATPSAEMFRLREDIDRALRHTQERRPGSAAFFSPDLIGREAILASLAELWSRAPSNPAVALIEGEEGLGKSRLGAELARRTRAAANVSVVLEVRAGESESHTEAATLRRLLAALAELPAIEDAPNRSLVELSRIAPELRRRFPQLASPREDSNQTEAALRSALRAIASDNPTLIVIDDFAHADPVSQRLLLGLAHELPPGILMVLTVRPEQIAGTDLVRELGRLPSARRLKLLPLTQIEVAALVDSMLELLPGDRETVSSRLTIESGGNPFYVQELVSALADAGMLTRTSRGTWALAQRFNSQALPVPPNLRAAVKLRLSQLSEGARGLLTAAAALDAPIDNAAAQAASGLSLHNFQPAVDELLARRLLRLSHDGRSGYEFSHDLIRRVAAERANAAPATHQEDRVPAVFRKSLARGGALMASAAAVAFTIVFLLNPSGQTVPPAAATAPPETHRIVVAAFVNETGDPEFDRLGQIVADWLTRGVAQTGLIAVLPPVVSPAGRTIMPDEFPRLSARVAPSMIVTGAIYRRGDSLRFEAQITNTREGTVRHAVDPVLVPVGDPMAGVESIRRKLVASLASSLDLRLSASANMQSTASSYEAYKIFATGLDEFYARRGDSNQRFLAAYSLDTAFTLPLLYAAMSYAGQGQYRRSDSLVKALWVRRDQLAPYDRHLLDYQAASLIGDLSAEYAAARSAADIAPGSFAAVALAPGAAMRLNHPAAAVRLLSHIDREHSAAKGLPVYWNILAHSYHMLGRYEDQLAIARELRRRIPEETRALYYEARALAVLGRLDELDDVLSEALSLPSVPAFGPPGLGAHQAAADELRAHGRPDDAARILERGLRFYQTAPFEVRNIPRFQHEIAYASYCLGRLPEARRIYERLVRTKALSGGDLRAITYYLAFVAAAQGDTTRVNAIVPMLRQKPERYMSGSDPFFLARLAALRGEKELAMRLLHQASAEGKAFDHTMHHIYEFQQLRGHKPFEQWLVPKG